MDQYTFINYGCNIDANECVKEVGFFFIILSQHTKQYEKLKLNFLGSKTTTWDGKNKNFHKKGKLKIKEKQK